MDNKIDIVALENEVHLLFVRVAEQVNNILLMFA